MNFSRSVKTDKTGLYVAEKVIEFPLTMVGEKSQVKVKICNGSGNTKYSVSLNDIHRLDWIIWGREVLRRTSFCLYVQKCQWLDACSI